MKTVNGYRKIVFDKHRITYRNESKDINVYIYQNPINHINAKDLHEVAYSRKDDKEHIIAKDLSKVNAEKKALDWIKSH